jgi:hypothetical protein
MPSPCTIKGALPKYARQQFRETGLLVDSCSFDPQVDIVNLRANEPGAPGVTKQTQVWTRDLNIELKGQPVSNAQGQMHGLAAVEPGAAVVCAHFAAATIEDGVEVVPAVARCGFTRDAAKLLQVGAPKLELGENTEFTLPMTYFRFINAADLIAIEA